MKQNKARAQFGRKVATAFGPVEFHPRRYDRYRNNTQISSYYYTVDGIPARCVRFYKRSTGR